MGTQPNQSLVPVSADASAVIALTRGGRAADAIARAANALERARGAVVRIAAAQERVAATPYPDDAMGLRAKNTATSLTAHQRGIAEKQAERARVWNRKAVRRMQTFERTEGRDVVSFNKIMRYACVVERAAALAEGQARWSDFYTREEE